MIQYWMKDQLATFMSGIRLTVDFEPDVKTYVTVFYEGGGVPDRFDFAIRRPNYMVWVEVDANDLGYAELLAEQTFQHFDGYHKKHPSTQIAVEYYKSNTLVKTEHYELLSMFAVGEPNPLGIENGKMQYSINFECVLIKKGES